MNDILVMKIIITILVITNIIAFYRIIEIEKRFLNLMENKDLKIVMNTTLNAVEGIAKAIKELKAKTARLEKITVRKNKISKKF